MKKFLVDAMLGKLALWLRLTGHDTFYDTEVHDDELLEIVISEKRIMLTADLELFDRAKAVDVDVMLVRSEVDERVRDVFMRYDIAPELDPSIARCSKCNGELNELRGVEKELVKDLVFEQTYNHYDVFWFCNDCKSVYFMGGHWKNMIGYMERISQLMKERTS
ncbi:MAG: Mut7-C RNAse domain-containing protein [Candidatus Thorarchaeota archaeon]